MNYKIFYCRWRTQCFCSKASLLYIFCFISTSYDAHLLTRRRQSSVLDKCRSVPPSTFVWFIPFQVFLVMIYRILMGKPEGKRSLGRPWRRWEDNIKTDLREKGCDAGDSIDEKLSVKFYDCNNGMTPIFRTFWRSFISDSTYFNINFIHHNSWCCTYITGKEESI